MFEIHMGVPEMETFWNTLTEEVSSGKASKNDVRLYNHIGKAMVLLANNPRHPGLQSHEIEALTARYGAKVWCSYLQNNAPAAGRIFWCYGPEKGDITIVAIEPHPNDSKSNAYQKITLSMMQAKKKWYQQRMDSCSGLLNAVVKGTFYIAGPRLILHRLAAWKRTKGILFAVLHHDKDNQRNRWLQAMEECLGHMKYVSGEQLFAVVTSDPGCGKSTLIRRLIHELPSEQYLCLYLSDSKLTPKGLYNGLIQQLGGIQKFYRGDAKLGLLLE